MRMTLNKIFKGDRVFEDERVFKPARLFNMAEIYTQVLRTNMELLIAGKFLIWIWLIVETAMNI